MTRTFSFILVVTLCSSATGCLRPRPEVRSSALPSCPSHDVVYCLDGAGGFQASSAHFRQAVADAGLPLDVQTIDWQHAPGRFLADQCDHAHAVCEGKRLAGAIIAHRCSCPDGKIYLLAHSAGSAVALSAAEYLPAGSLERIVLLAPSVAADHDLRPALVSTRQGIDVFCSRRDVWYLGVGVGIVGTADRSWTAAAGRVGFRPVIACAPDELLYARLHQHAWEPCEAWTGNSGGHYGGYQPEFLRAYVLPLFR